MLEMGAVSHVSNREPVLIRASLTVRPGECVSVLGLAPAGRKAFLKCLETGQSDAGDIRLDGRPLREARRARGAVARAGGEGYPVSGRSARQALERARGGANVSDAAASAGLHGKLDTAVKMLDLDQRVRLGIACAVIQRPRLLLLEAPVAGLAGHDRDRLLVDLPKLVSLPGAMVILAAGSADEALALGGEALIVDEGLAVHTGPVREAFDRPGTLAAARAVATPQLNVLAIGEGGALADGSRFNPPPGLHLPAGASTLAFRPGDASLERRGPDCLRFAARVSVDAASSRYTRLTFAGADWFVPAAATPLTPGIVTSVFVPVGKLMVFDSEGQAVG